MLFREKGEPDLAFVGLLLLIVFGVMIFNDRPIQSPRPYDLPYPQPLDRQLIDHTYESWQWEDPFGFNPGALQESDLYQIETDKLPDLNNLQIKLHKSLDVDGLTEKNIENADQCSYQLNIKMEEINKGTKILAPIVKIRPRTVENKENRTRHRYAVTAGLIASGYTAAEPNRLHFCISPNQSSNKRVKTYNVRWEHFAHDSKPDVIVTWISSNTSINDFPEEVVWKTIPLRKIYVYDLNNSLEPGVKKSINYTDIQLVNSLNHDQKPRARLTNKLVDELNLRNVTNLSEIAIINEHGSKKANKLADCFKQVFKNGSNQEKLCNQEEETNNEIEINQFFYLKGLDANQQNIKKQDQPDSQALKNWNEYFSVHDHRNPAIGHAQFDYLHRLVQQIKASQKDPLKPNRIKAIGIFGSDFYDKLIILEALRREMPNILFFTTDLDAQMLQPEYWNWTRNLIVASHFDLRLNERYQKSSPPFRDSLQTEIYYQTLVNFGGIEMHENSPPLIFEIGRNGPVYLPQETAKPSVHPSYDQQGQLKYYLAFCFLITIALIFTEYQMRPSSGAQTYWLSISAILLFLLIYIFALDNMNKEPFSFTDGVSIWPTILIRTFTLLLTLAFIIKLVRILEVSFDRLTRKEFSNLQAAIRPLIFADVARKTEEEMLEEIDSKLSNDNRSENNHPKSETVLFNKGMYTFFMLVSILGFMLATNRLPVPESLSFAIGGILLLVLSSLSSLAFFINPENDPTKLVRGIGLLVFFAIGCLFVKNYLAEEKNLLVVLIVFLLAVFNLLVYAYGLTWNTISKLKTKSLKLVAPLFVFTFFIIVTFIIADHPELILLITVLLLLTFWAITHGKIRSIQNWIQHDSIRNQQDSPDQSGDNALKKIIKEDKLWQEYREHGVLKQRLLRTTIIWLVFMNVDAFLIHIFPESSSPCRGNTCYWDSGIFAISFSIAMFLIFLVLDAQRLCLHWIEKLRTKHPLLVDETILYGNAYYKKLRDEYGIYKKRNDRNALQSLEKIVMLVAKRTRAVDRLIYYPIIALILMLFARIQYFDNLDFPMSSGLVFIVSISLLLYAGLKLRGEASRLKLAVINSAKYKLPCNDKAKLKNTIKTIQEVGYGAFQPLMDQPAFRSALLLLGAIGLFATEYLMLFGY